MKKFFYSMLVVILLSGCTALMQRMAVKELDFSLERVSLVDYNLSNMTLKLDLKAENPNDIDAVIDRLDYSLYINDKNAANGTTAREVTVKAGGTKNISTSMTVNYVDLGTAILEAVKEKKADFKMEGTVFVETPIGSITFPIDLLYP
jgi:LEA14-like dessication related protein